VAQASRLCRRTREFRTGGTPAPPFETGIYVAPPVPPPAKTTYKLAKHTQQPLPPRPQQANQNHHANEETISNQKLGGTGETPVPPFEIVSKSTTKQLPTPHWPLPTPHWPLPTPYWLLPTPNWLPQKKQAALSRGLHSLHCTHPITRTGSCPCPSRRARPCRRESAMASGVPSRALRRPPPSHQSNRPTAHA
jgi:hypothetical protein